MDEASHCHRLAFIYRGRIIAEGTPHEIRTDYMRDVILEIETPDAEKALVWLERSGVVREAYASGATLHAVVARDDAEPGATTRTHARLLADHLTSAGITVDAVHPVDPSIEDVFVHLAGSQKGGER
jgi:ABC-2 type transport system ATP-binding protein